MSIEAKYAHFVKKHDCFSPNSPYVSDAPCRTFLETCRMEFAQQPFKEELLLRFFVTKQIVQSNVYFFKTHDDLKDRETIENHIEKVIIVVNCAVRRHFNKPMDEERLRGMILDDFNELAQHWYLVLGKEEIDARSPRLDQFPLLIATVKHQVAAPLFLPTQHKLRTYLRSKLKEKLPA